MLATDEKALSVPQNDETDSFFVEFDKGRNAEKLLKIN